MAVFYRKPAMAGLLLVSILAGCQSSGGSGIAGKTSLNSLLGLNKGQASAVPAPSQVQNSTPNTVKRPKVDGSGNQMPDNRPAAGYVSPDCFQFAYSAPGTCVPDIKMMEKL